MIDKLTPEQEALIPVYREKWRKVVFSTEPINREKATEAVKIAYDLIGRPNPKTVFVSSPCSEFVKLVSQHKILTFSPFQVKVPIRLKIKFGSQIDADLWEIINISLGESSYGLVRSFYAQLIAPLYFKRIEGNKYEGRIYYSLIADWVYAAGVVDYCTSVLNCRNVLNILEIYNLIIENCGLIVPCREVCFICDRPRQLSFDSQQRLHAEGEPAVQYADGYSLYSYHGVTLPEKYGKVHPQHWHSQWLLEEDNAELRRVLIQGIGYNRLCQELQANEIDSWKEYSLLKIDSEVDIEPIYLLKMTCPSTGFIHALRVPPNFTAREAIAWINWDIDSEEFSIQT